MKQFNWKAERDRLEKMAKDLGAMNGRICARSTDLSWCKSISRIAEDIDFLARQMDAQKCK